MILSDRSDFPTRPCSESQLSQALLELDNLSALGALPVGCITWWTGSHTSLPHRWVIADGTDNHADLGGSGYNLINYFIMATATDSDVGDTTAAVTETGLPSSHSHWGTAEPVTITAHATVNSESHKMSLGADNTHPTEDYKRKITLGGETIVLSGGHHSHNPAVEYEESPAKQYHSNHYHEFTVPDESENLGTHTCADLVSHIDDHADHRHRTQHWHENTAQYSDSTAGSYISSAAHQAASGSNPALNIETGLQKPAGGSAGDNLDHDAKGGVAALSHTKHNHTEYVWFSAQHHHEDVTNPMGAEAGGSGVGHTHPFGWIDSGSQNPLEDGSEHQHNWLHGHEPKEITWDSLTSHSLAGATHPHDATVTAAPHFHTIEMLPESSHTHTAGNPDNMTLIPIERMP